MRSILIIACDFYLAGIYGRKFEHDGWDVEIAESIADGKTMIAKMQPDVVLLEKDCTKDIVDLVRELKGLPTMQSAKLVILAKESDRDEIQKARNAGADQYLLLGHFVPHEAVEKIRQLVS
ncbi:response regulator transcription factor [Candidatus Uhrbacteria bacterium]|jgi:DNA-binding response OmpR family regulator|nr:response regulator transcription factor [Candidatus Uhrbacteria bacterium]MBT7717295.1 response regulator transcription factor [Candidatus Uhrbacteria bacterium]